MIQTLLGERLKAMRMERGYTQEQLVELARTYAPQGKKVVREALSRIENGRTRADSWTIAAYAKALETTTDYLLGETDDPSVSDEPPFPIPTPDLYRLVDRLNRQPVALRRLAVQAIEAVFEYAELYSSTFLLDKPADDVAVATPESAAIPAPDTAVLASLLDARAHSGVVRHNLAAPDAERLPVDVDVRPAVKRRKP